MQGPPGHQNRPQSCSKVVSFTNIDRLVREWNAFGKPAERSETSDMAEQCPGQRKGVVPRASKGQPFLRERRTFLEPAENGSGQSHVAPHNDSRIAAANRIFVGAWRLLVDPAGGVELIPGR